MEWSVSHQLVFSEDSEGWAHFVCGVVRGAAAPFPCLLQYLSDTHPNLPVKAGVLARASDIETTTISRYYQQVRLYIPHNKLYEMIHKRR